MRNKNQNALRRLQVKKAIPLSQSDEDKRIIDLTLKTLYNDAHKGMLHLEAEIYKPLKIKLSYKEANRLWHIMTSTGLIAPVIGFGNAGKIELTRTGYQLMSQFGSYKDYIASLNNNQPQTVILPIQIEGDDNSQEAEPLTGEKTPAKQRAKKLK